MVVSFRRPRAGALPFSYEEGVGREPHEPPHRIEDIQWMRVRVDAVPYAGNPAISVDQEGDTLGNDTLYEPVRGAEGVRQRTVRRPLNSRASMVQEGVLSSG